MVWKRNLFNATASVPSPLLMLTVSWIASSTNFVDHSGMEIAGAGSHATPSLDQSIMVWHPPFLFSPSLPFFSLPYSGMEFAGAASHAAPSLPFFFLSYRSIMVWHPPFLFSPSLPFFFLSHRSIMVWHPPSFFLPPFLFSPSLFFPPLTGQLWSGTLPPFFFLFYPKWNLRVCVGDM